MRLAYDCGAVVKAKNRVVGAVVILQRAWRDTLERRKSGAVPHDGETQMVRLRNKDARKHLKNFRPIGKSETTDIWLM